MVLKFFTKIFGSSNDRILKKIQPLIDSVNALEPQIQALSDTQMAEKTNEFRSRLTNGETLDDILPEAFALVREASVS